MQKPQYLLGAAYMFTTHASLLHKGHRVLYTVDLYELHTYTEDVPALPCTCHTVLVLTRWAGCLGLTSCNPRCRQVFRRARHFRACGGWAAACSLQRDAEYGARHGVWMDAGLATGRADCIKWTLTMIQWPLSLPSLVVERFEAAITQGASNRRTYWALPRLYVQQQC